MMLQILEQRGGGPRRAAGRFFGDRRGAVAVMIAVVAIPLIIISGMAVDGSRMWLVRARLQAAVDAAALVAAKEIDIPTRNADAVGLFWANFNRTAARSLIGYMGASSADPTVTVITATTIKVAATAQLATTFMQFAGISSVTVQASAVAMRQTIGMELSLILDNTGSMKGWPIESLRTAAAQLVDIVYGSGTQDVVPNLNVAVVPFTAEVNIGPGHSGWLVPGSLDQTAYGSAGWTGCVFARHSNGHDFDDATPAAAPFVPFRYPSTLGQIVSGKPAIGDNDWSPGNITESNQANLPDNTAVGPSLGCDALAVLPLTASRLTVKQQIAQMVQTYRGGTFINMGLQAGWFTLSPRWRGLWGNPALPLDYGAANMRKVIVLMTDGNNEWFSWPGGSPDNQGDADVTSYGRLSQNVLSLTPNTQANATAYINASMATMCTNIKASGIVIYTVLFNHDAVSAATETLFKNCASSPDNYFLTPTNSDLQGAFNAIGTELASLRLVH
jgi:Flp pilus assembly protein TadG